MYAPQELRKKQYDYRAASAVRAVRILAGVVPSPIFDDTVAIALDLWSGKRVGDIAKERDWQWTNVRTVATAIGWDESWVVGRKRGGGVNKGPTRTCGTMPVDELLRRFDAGESLVSIGAAAGVSRERVRQVAEMNNRQPRRMTSMGKRILKRESARAASVARREYRRLASKAAFIARWSEAIALWDAGVPITKIAKICGTTNDRMGWYTHTGRRRFGLFPLRRPHLSRKHTPGVLGNLTIEDVVARVRGGEDPRDVAAAADVSLWRVRRACTADGMVWKPLPPGCRAAK